jgi:hypothetical protein
MPDRQRQAWRGDERRAVRLIRHYVRPSWVYRHKSCGRPIDNKWDGEEIERAV